MSESHATSPSPGRFTPRQIRIQGALLLVIGTLLAIGMVVALIHEAPTFLNPGVEIDGARFTGSVEQGRMAVALLGWIGLLGVTFAGIGAYQLRIGKRNAWLLYLAGGMIVITVAAAWKISGTFG